MSDVTMGSYDGAEICELVCLFILESIAKRFGKENVGLCRDDELTWLADWARKNVIKIFEDLGLKITAPSNQNTTNFLDVTFNLSDGKFHPYRKPNDDPLYINSHSNHPPSIIKKIPSNHQQKNLPALLEPNILPMCRTALRASPQDSNFQADLQHADPPNEASSQRKQRRINIIWFNPTFSKSIKTNIGRSFLQLIDKHFPFRINCTLFSTEIQSRSATAVWGIWKLKFCNHNTRILSTQKRPNPPDKSDWKLQKIKRMPAPRKLSSHQRHLQSRNFALNWSILGHTVAYKAGARQCNLCVEEKLHLLKADKRTLLNKRTEIVSKCRYENKFYACNQSRGKSGNVINQC